MSQTLPDAPAAGDTIVALRTELFATLRGLGDKANPMEIERAKAIADVAQTIINSAKVEVDAMRVLGGQGSGFIPSAPRLPGQDNGTTVITAKPGLRVTQHRLKG